jgi:CMP-N,N'-diacetyllegionaminic acid synthase
MKIALIPARGGSKRLPGKNMLPLGGKPLVAHTIEVVIESKLFDVIIVSSDDEKVLHFAKNYRNVQAWSRPKHLAADTATTSQVLLDVLNEIKCATGVCGIFLPTSPLRKSHHIVEAMELLAGATDSVVSVTYYSSPLAFRMRFSDAEEGRLTIPDNSPLIYGKTRSQEHEHFVYPNGAIYINRIDSFLSTGSFFEKVVFGYMMNKIESIDIDSHEDYLIAQSIYNLCAQGA